MDSEQKQQLVVNMIEVTQHGEVVRKFIPVPNDERVEEHLVDPCEQPAFNGRRTQIRPDYSEFEW